MIRDDEVVPLAQAIAWQRNYVVEMGSPVAALVLDTAVERPKARALLPDTARFGSLPGLRWMAAIHRLAIDRKAPAVALHLPTLGGSAPVPAAVDDFKDAVVEAALSHPGVVMDYLTRVPQTNDVGRAAVLRCALSRLDPSLPVRIFEFGCSAGLNLRVDHLPGLPQIEAGPLPPVIGRFGCDLSPIDPSTADGRALLSSYIWVDDVRRWAALQEAFVIAAKIPVHVAQQDAATFIASITPARGACTVVWHSAMWIYLTASERRNVMERITALAAHATPEAPVAHIAWEWHERQSQGPFELTSTYWDGLSKEGLTSVIATGTSHGNSVALL